MNNPHFDKSNALSAAIIGFEFEFFSDMVRGRMVEQLSKLLGKKVILSEKYHSGIEVNATQFKLEPDYSGGNNMNELITGPLTYAEAIPILIKCLKWIGENGWTTDKCAFQFNVSFDKMRRDITEKIETMDKLKFILGIDENLIYSKFGNRHNSVYARSIKKVVPRNRFSVVENISSIDPRMFKLPDEKYYGVNFTKAKDGYLEIRYLGGRNYEKKITQIREVIDYVIYYMYENLSGRRQYEKRDLEALNKLMGEYSKVVKSFSDPNVFFMQFPDFHLMVDLKGLEENIKTYFPMIREKVFDLIVDSNLTQCYFNYDTSTGRYQIKEGRFRDASKIEGLDLIDCDIKNSNLYNCSLYSSKLKNCQVFESQLMAGNKIADSKVQDTEVKYSNSLSECYISSPGKIIDGDIKGGVIRKGDIGRNAKISESTQKVLDGESTNKFISDPRLHDVNLKVQRFKFGDLNWKYRKY